MTSPRIDRSPLKHTSLLLTALLFGPAVAPLCAQTVVPPATPDTTARSRDTASTAIPGAPAQRPDTTPAPPGARPDTLGPDTLGPDTSRTGTPNPDTLRDTTSAGARASGARTPAAAPPPPPPVDSALAAACRESGGEPPDLLAVVFRSVATPAEREAAAREVGGTLVEQSRHQAPGAWYLHVPGSGFNPLIADRVIRLPPVLEVSATRCPT